MFKEESSMISSKHVRYFPGINLLTLLNGFSKRNKFNQKDLICINFKAEAYHK